MNGVLTNAAFCKISHEIEDFSVCLLHLDLVHVEIKFLSNETFLILLLQQQW